MKAQFPVVCMNIGNRQLPWKSRVLTRAQLEFAQRVNLGTSNILTPRFPRPRTLTNHIGVSEIGGAKSVAVLPSGYPTPILLIGRSVIQLCAVIFSHACLVPLLKVFSTGCQILQLSRWLWISRLTVNCVVTFSPLS